VSPRTLQIALVYNDKIRDLYKSPSIVWKMKSRSPKSWDLQRDEASNVSETLFDPGNIFKNLKIHLEHQLMTSLIDILVKKHSAT
jgi:hypothetical protein